MKISVIIPSFNQGPFLEETLHSVLAQTQDVTCEVLVLDGGSTDGTVDILRGYADCLAYVESVADRGQTHAINKGLARMTGDVWMYLNSDDLLAPGALARVAQGFADPKVMWISGACENFDSTGPIGAVRVGRVERMKDYLAPWNRRSQYVFPFSGACYMRREVVEQIGFFNESYSYSMDIEYYCRAMFEGGFSQTTISDVLARWRRHSASKTTRQGIPYAFRAESVRIAQQYAHCLPSDQQAELEDEIHFQLKWLPVREAMWLLGEGRRREALALLLRAARAAHSLPFSRPWLGVLRRAILGFDKRL